MRFLPPLLAAVAAALVFFAGVTTGHISMDDWGYIYGCPFVRDGLSAANVAAAFSQFGYDAFWMPLTFISYMADITFFGGGWAVHHAVCVAIHAANAALAFVLLKRLASVFAPEASPRETALASLAAALFWALHPMRAETVVYIAARKDLLWTFFALLGLIAWIGHIRRGVGMATFWYNTAVYPISLETSSNRMLLNLDGTVTFQCGETEIGQGADTAYAQMVAEAVGLSSYKDVRVKSCQDTDITPTGLGAYASRQTYVAGFAIRQTADLLRGKILASAAARKELAAEDLDVVDSCVVLKSDGSPVITLSELAMTAQYDPVHSEHITAESTYTIRSNAYSFGCTFAEIEVDIPMCKVKIVNMVNVHDCGSLINPALAAAQVHGGMSMAIGFGLSEQLLFDEKTGKPLNNNLLDYKLSTFMDHPHLEAQFIENPEPTSPFGTKALGEPPTCSGAPALRNAIYNATGVAIDRNPINPHVLYEEFSRAGLIRDAWKEET